MFQSNVAHLLILCFSISWVPAARAACQHTVVTPKGFRLDTTEKIYIDFHGCADRVSITMKLSSLPTNLNTLYEVEKVNIAHRNKPVEMEIKATSGNLEIRRGNPVYKAKLIISYQSPPSGRKINVTPMTILLNKTHGYVFMTTNRPAYRPTESVKIKVAVTNQDLMLGERRRVKVLIKTPVERITVDVSAPSWTDENGFVDFTYVVPDNPMEGIWWAEAYVDGVKMAEKSFLVDKYVLPTFDVKILPDYHFYIPGNSISGRITAEYSYGKKVSGLCYLSLKLIRANGDEVEFYKRPARFDRQFVFTRGITPYRVEGSDIESYLGPGETMQDLVAEGARISITASVTGAVESVFESDYIDNILVTNEPYFIDHSQSARFFIPGVVYEVKIIVRDIVSKKPLPNVPVTINWREENDEEPRDTDENGEFYYEVNGLSEPVEIITISAHNEDFDITVTDEIKVRKYDANRAMSIRLQKQMYAIGERLFVRFAIGNNAVSDIRYFVIARGKFVRAEGIAEIDDRTEVSINFEVTADMVPYARIVAYYVLDNDMTSNSVWFDVVDQCKNELEITTDKEEVEPGEQVTVTVHGSPGSAFHLYGIDRASYYLHNLTRVNRNQLWSKMEEYDTGCSRKGGLDAIHVFEEAGLAISSGMSSVRSYRKMYCENSRNKRSPRRRNEQDDQNIAMQQKCYRQGIKENVFGITCEKRERKIRKNFIEMGKSEAEIVSCIAEFHKGCLEVINSWEPELMRAANSAKDSGLGARVKPRRAFQEDWSFLSQKITADGRYSYTNILTKHSITTFELDAFGMSENSPMCVAKTQYLKLFKDIFIQLYLPYSVRLREQTTIRVSVFNYGDEPKQIEVLLKHTDHLCSRFQGTNFLTLVDFVVPPANAQTTEFTVLPVKTGKAEITVAAAGEERDEDSILKELLVEEQGVHNESSQTIVIKQNDDGTAKVQRLLFDFPTKESVMMLQTRKCEIYAYAHPMGPNVEIDPFDDKINIGNYIIIPFGCGEQNMLFVAPVIYIHMYRLSAKVIQVTKAQEEQVTKSIRTGYTNELSHRSDVVKKMAFAVWKSHKPCTWLNAFVVKVFTEAREYLEGLKLNPICNALGWLLSMQEGNGKFRENYKIVHHPELRNLGTDEFTLTAYVIISLAEAREVCPDYEDDIESALSDGLQYVKQHYDNARVGSYSLAMGAYAIAVSEKDDEEKSEEARKWNRMLRSRSQNDGEYIFWRGTRNDAANIETTAYALLAELTLNGITEENDDLTRNIAHWLVTKRNANGGHKSTQDTVVAMQALTMYMTILEATDTLRPPVTDLFLDISPLDKDSNWTTETVHLTGGDLVQRQTIEVDSSVVEGVSISTTGDGVGSLTYRCTWRQFNNDENCHFILDVDVIDVRGSSDMKTVKVNVKTRPGDPAAGMSIIDFGVPSGWSPDESSIKDICPDGAVDYQVDRYEIVRNTVKFYIDEIDENGKQLGFKINKVADIRNSQPVAVSAYDYYEPDIKCTKFYNVEGLAQIRAIGCDDPKTCKCAEGDCPICRTREKQLHETLITTSDGLHDTLCDFEEDCDNMHTILCRRTFVYTLIVTEVGDAIQGYKYFLGKIIEAYRTTPRHMKSVNSTAKFIIRDDCRSKCTDNRFAEAAKKKGLHNNSIPQFVSDGRVLLVSGLLEPVKGAQWHEYDLTGGGIEIMVPEDTCKVITSGAKKLGKKARQKRKICEMKSILRDAIFEGCDV